jgi:phosphomannomutase
MSPDELVAAARAWRDADPDPETRAEVDRLLGDHGTPGAAGGDDHRDHGATRDQGAVPAAPDLAALAERFGAGLQFGTAGLRGEMAAGPNRMNRAVVIRATAGLAAHLAATGHGGEPVVVGFDARHRSERFAHDAAAVLAAAGFPVHLADRPVPTPVVAFGVTWLGCCAGVQVTASHNPPRDNGYKVYLGDGAQIVPPSDREISARIDAVGPAASVPRAADGDPRIVAAGDDLIDAYVTAAVAQTPLPPGAPRAAEPEPGGGAPPAQGSGWAPVRIVYTPLHGVGRDVLSEVLTRAGFNPPVVVAEQGAPDPDFPTVAFPNPEEPGALDLALALAASSDADVVVANDPDADRLAVAVPVPAGGAGRDGWRALTGDEIGVLLADWLLELGEGADRLVVTTVVSSSMLGRLAAARGVSYAETLTGFKWLARAALDRPDLRFVYGYEEALGSCVGTLVRDKDGITAALAFAGLVAAAKGAGRTVTDRLDDLARELGVHATGQRSVALAGPGGLDRAAATVDRLATSPPAELAGMAVGEVEDLRAGGRLPPTDGVVIRGEGVRLIVRPSGTEPKLKCYAEAVVPVTGQVDLAAARSRAEAAMRSILDEAVALADTP